MEIEKVEYYIIKEGNFSIRYNPREKERQLEFSNGFNGGITIADFGSVYGKLISLREEFNKRKVEKVNEFNKD